MELFLLRHPAFAESTHGRCIGQIDLASIPVPDAERREILECCAEREIIFSSDLQRTATLAARLAHDSACVHCSDARLREVSFGNWEGLMWEEIEARSAEACKLWMEDFVKLAPPGGESLLALSERVLAWKNAALRDFLDKRVLAVSHSGVIRVLLCDALGIPLQNAFRLQIDYLTMSSILYGRSDSPQVRSMNQQINA